jgi:hypothetical protein
MERALLTLLAVVVGAPIAGAQHGGGPTPAAPPPSHGNSCCCPPQYSEQHMLVLNTSQASGPCCGTTSCPYRRRRRYCTESTCEGHGYNRHQCTQVGCCQWEDDRDDVGYGKCWYDGNGCEESVEGEAVDEEDPEACYEMEGASAAVLVR